MRFLIAIAIATLLLQTWNGKEDAASSDSKRRFGLENINMETFQLSQMQFSFDVDGWVVQMIDNTARKVQEMGIDALKMSSIVQRVKLQAWKWFFEAKLI